MGRKYFTYIYINLRSEKDIQQKGSIMKENDRFYDDWLVPVTSVQ